MQFVIHIPKRFALKAQKIQLRLALESELVINIFR